MTLPTLTKEERELFNLFKREPTTKVEEVNELVKHLNKVKALCLQEDPFEAARFKWLWLAYGMEEGWLEKELSSNFAFIKASEGLGLRTNNEFCKFCQDTDLNCGACELQPYTGTGCELVWDFWLERNEPLPTLEAVLQASIDKEFAKAKQACSPWKKIEEEEVLDIFDKHWKAAPWLVNLKTGRNTKGSTFHSQFTGTLAELLGEEASTRYPKANWKEGLSSIHGWVWFGFRTKAQMLEGKAIYERLGGKYE